MTCDQCLEGTQKALESGGVPGAAASNTLGRNRCPMCKAFVGEDGVCHNPQCSTNSSIETWGSNLESASCPYTLQTISDAVENALMQSIIQDIEQEGLLAAPYHVAYQGDRGVESLREAIEILYGTDGPFYDLLAYYCKSEPGHMSVANSLIHTLNFDNVNDRAKCDFWEQAESVWNQYQRINQWEQEARHTKSRDEVRKRREAIEHIIEEGLVVRDSRKPVKFYQDDDNGWVFSHSFSEARQYSASKEIDAEIARLETDS